MVSVFPRKIFFRYYISTTCRQHQASSDLAWYFQQASVWASERLWMRKDRVHGISPKMANRSQYTNLGFTIPAHALCFILTYGDERFWYTSFPIHALHFTVNRKALWNSFKVVLQVSCHISHYIFENLCGIMWLQMQDFFSVNQIWVDYIHRIYTWFAVPIWNGFGASWDLNYFNISGTCHRLLLQM